MWIAVFWLILYIILYPYREKLESNGIRIYPLFLVVKKKTGFKSFDKLSKKKIIGVYAVIGIALTLVSLFLFYYYAVSIFLSRYVFETGKAGGLIPIIPGVTIGWEIAVYILFSIGVAAVVHEFSHAIMALRENIEVKSIGFFLAYIIPAAFVEVDEEKLEKAPLLSRAKIVSAGPASNLVLGAVFLLLLHLIVMAPAGIIVAGVEEHSPAHRAGLLEGDIIKYVNNTRVDSLLKLRNIVLSTSGKNTSLILVVKRGDDVLRVVVKKYYNESLLGIRVKPTGILSTLSISSYIVLLNLVNYMALINLSLALINAAPLFITDGAHLLKSLLGRTGVGGIASTTIQIATLIITLSIIYLP